MIRGILHQAPRFLSFEEVLTLHETGIDEYGGTYGLRDQGLLDSALAMPKQVFGDEYPHEFPFGMAGAYLFHLCKNHAFVDGNKRLALMACIAFLRLNGWNFTASEESAVETVLAVAEGRLTKNEVSAWVAANVRARPTLELREFMARLDYQVLASVFGAIAAGGPNERVASIQEAAHAIPAIDQANMGAVAAEEGGDAASTQILRQHAILLTAVYRIAEDMGYEW